MMNYHYHFKLWDWINNVLHKHETTYNLPENAFIVSSHSYTSKYELKLDSMSSTKNYLPNFTMIMTYLNSCNRTNNPRLWNHMRFTIAQKPKNTLKPIHQPLLMKYVCDKNLLITMYTTNKLLWSCKLIVYLYLSQNDIMGIL